MGTRYQLQFVLPQENDVVEGGEKILDEVSVLVSIVADDIRHIICRQLLRWGAKYEFPEESLFRSTMQSNNYR